MTTTETTLIRLNHPVGHYAAGSVIELPTAEAFRLVQQGARYAEDLVQHAGGGWYEVELHNPARRVRIHGKDRAIKALTLNSEDI
jgi:hypothetical protein